VRPAHFEVVAAVDLRHWWFLGRRRILREVLAAVLPPGRGALVIDIGCGTGANIAALCDRYECIGIDTSPDAIRLARQRFGGVRFICGAAPGDLGEAAGRAGAVLLMDVLEHVPDDAALLGPIVEALAPGALVLVTVPADPRLWSEHDVSLGHYRRYDAPALRRIWSSLPVSEMMVSYFNARLYPLVRAARALGRLRGRAWGREGTDMAIPRGPINRVLERVFAGEGRRLADLAAGRPRGRRGYARGVSLMALLRREPGGARGRTSGPKDGGAG
jgi:SAM-dependent methyltransferase